MITRTTIGVLAAASLTAAAGNVTTNWDSGTFEGWTFTPSAPAGTWDVFATGGNPDGYISYFDGPDGMATPVVIDAPSSYYGDYSSFGAGAGFSYDAIWESTQFSPINAPVIRIFGDNGEIAEGFGLGVNTSGWDSFFIGFDESEWNVIAGDFSDLLQNVTRVTISGDNGIGPDREAGVDNFTLVVPAPSGAAILGLGALAATRRRR